MVKRQRASGSSLFLMELIIAIMLFCVASSICILAFVNSHLMHRDSTLQSKAVEKVQNTAEAIRAGDSYDQILNNLKVLYPGKLDSVSSSDLLNDKLIIEFDSDFKPTESQGTYKLTIESEDDDGLFCSIITFMGDEPIFDLYVEHLVY